METLLGLLGVALFVIAMLALSAAVTFAVVRVSALRRKDARQVAE